MSRKEQTERQKLVRMAERQQIMLSAGPEEFRRYGPSNLVPPDPAPAPASNKPTPKA